MAIGKLELRNYVYTLLSAFLNSRLLPVSSPTIKVFLDLTSGPLHLPRGWLLTIVGRVVLRIEGRAFVGLGRESSAREPLGQSFSKGALRYITYGRFCGTAILYLILWTLY